MKRKHLVNVATAALVAGVLGVCIFGSYSAVSWLSGPPTKPAVVQPPRANTRPVVRSELVVEPTAEPAPAVEVVRYDSVESYFSAGNPNPLSHRLGEPPYKRGVSSSQRRRIIERDGGACLVCGSTHLLEVDHRIALMNNGDNSDENLGTLCDSCHVEKTRYDWAIKRKRRKMAESQ